MVGALRDSLLPLYIISKISCTHTFSRKRLRTSFLGSLIAAFVAIAYAIFHVESAHRTLKDDKYEASVNAVTAIIDSYNRYSGVCGFGIIIVASIMVQGKIVRTIQLLEHVDSVLQQNYSHHVDNTAWIMYGMANIRGGSDLSL